MTFRERELLIFDGACGTSLQALDFPASVWQGHDGCNEWLNLAAPEVITRMHAHFVEAGAMALETNTFGASRLVLAEYGLAERVGEINAAAVANARRATAGRPGVHVVGALGPGTKLPSLGHVPVETLAASCQEQAQALVDAGVDALIIETCQDLLQVKTALVACFEVVENAGRDVPVLLSLTLEQTGVMLVGSTLAAAVATVEPFPLFALGLNCATGPADMEPHIRFLARTWPGRISCMPNQGLPEIVDGHTCYRLGPDDYAQAMRHFVLDCGVSVVGGCCGSTPAHIRHLVRALDGVRPATREVGA